MMIVHLLFTFLFTVSVILGEEKCNTPADIAFVIDSSSSIWLPNFQKQISFVQFILKSFNLDTIHVAALTFSSDVEIEYTFNDVENAQEAYTKTGNIEHAAGLSTFTHNALEEMRKTLFSPEEGAREGVAHICILLTDGESTKKPETLVEAAKARAAGIKIIAIGIGAEVNETELKAIVSQPVNKHYFSADDFDKLQTELDDFGLKACEAINLPPLGPPEGQSDEPAKKCEGKEADILFVVDSSSSIWPVDFENQLQFIIDVVDVFDINSGLTRVGMLKFSTVPEIQFHLNTFQTKKEIQKALHAVKTKGGLTNTHLALQQVRTEMFTKEHGYRKDVAHICVVITDGKSRNQAETKKEADLLHTDGVEIISIGVGKEKDKEELGYIASRPEYVFEVDGYDVLKTIEKDLTEKTCDAVARPEELKDAEAKKECRGRIQDIFFVVDMSSSIWKVDFEKQLEFLAELVRFFDINRGFTRVAMLTFSNSSDVIFYLNEYDEVKALQEAILGVETLGGLTNTHLALERVMGDMMDEKHGYRPEAETSVVVITDGESREQQKTKDVAAKLHKKVTDVIVIGVGEKVNIDELTAIASEPEFVFPVGGYDLLETIKDKLVETTCTGVRSDTSCEDEVGGTTAFETFVGADVHLYPSDMIVFDKVIYNINGAYDPTTGIFTAQISGLYRFAYSAKFDWMSQDVHAMIMKNGEVIDTANFENTISKDVSVLDLEAGDEISVQVFSFDGGNGDVLEDYTTFSGVLLYDKPAKSGKASDSNVFKNF